ncbi:phosphotransferase [Paenalcaligenes niemegkensis]|uniref:phosphotransferase n=1 Tax=Paenalcaligenes niemegkensis TaxID=2895469 RepID=UPI001EE897BF|nr:phosphotransferase [Paenalcaligenes niemegkensis]MCQ9618144.1 phosphotransferase [Paenalcaligenes niemegkensis]
MTTFVPTAEPGIALANSLLTTSPPRVGIRDALQVMADFYQGAVSGEALSGERDKNFYVRRPEGSYLTLKFINNAETPAETEMQISVLKHLAQVGLERAVPQHISCANAGGNWLSYSTEEGPVRVRAYSFIGGESGSFLKPLPVVWRDIGIAAGQLDQALASFEHNAAHRAFLWDASQVLLLKPMLSAVKHSSVYEDLLDFMTQFERVTQPALCGLPHQVIHNDLSPSNMLSCDDGLRVAGILDFGDLVYAPRIAEIAVAASYQMGEAAKPLDVLGHMLEGYASIVPLSASERRYVMDLVLARLVQRMVITSWRASQFPCNSAYILRSHDSAKELFEQLIGPWLQANKGAQLS